MYKREVTISNLVSIILGSLTTLLLLTLIGLFGMGSNTPIVLVVILFFFSIPLLNKAGHINLSRVLLASVPPILVISAALFGRLYDRESSDMSYYDSRLYLIVCSVVPCLIFEHRERWRLFGSLSSSVLCLVLFDPIHEYFNVGYYQEGFTGKSYTYINYASLMTMTAIVTAAISLRRVIRRAEDQTLVAMTKLKEANTNLELQNEEIQAQREELYASQELLREANKVIEQRNNNLQQEVTDVNGELEIANRELLRQNTELLQFSYTISHNLRGPIARLLGLTNLANLSVKDNIPDATLMPVIGHIKKSAEDLDDVFRDLGMILETRDALHHQMQNIDLYEMWEGIVNLLDIDSETKSGLHADFSQSPTIRSIRPFIHSIIFNLINNAIKFRSQGRKLDVSIHSVKQDKYTEISVSDNGLGIDLEKFNDEVFKMYKRFHLHKEGKGLGLYLVRSQAELMGGYVTVSSIPDQGTTFRVYIIAG